MSFLHPFKTFSKLGNLKPVIRFKHRASAREAIDKLVENSKLDTSFFVMCGLSGLLATLGILLNDTAVLISAMVLAPLLNPVLALAAGISIFNKKLIFYALKSLTGSIIFIILLSALLVKILIFKGYYFAEELDIFTQKFSELNDLLFLAAFVSGFSGVYAWLRKKDASNMIGVAIAVSLIPFVSFFGVLIGMNQSAEIHWFAFAFGINLASILLGAICAFLLLGFRTRKKQLDKEVEVEIEANK